MTSTQGIPRAYAAAGRRTSPPLGITDFPLFAAAGTIDADRRWQLETWAEPLQLGEALPTMPLWVADDLAVPLDLDAGAPNVKMGVDLNAGGISERLAGVVPPKVNIAGGCVGAGLLGPATGCSAGFGAAFAALAGAGCGISTTDTLSSSTAILSPSFAPSVSSRRRL